MITVLGQYHLKEDYILFSHMILKNSGQQLTHQSTIA